MRFLLKITFPLCSRIYPKGSRIDSSNYDPAVCWVAGCQMVALNYQTNDFYLHVNHGRFRENGNCGYIVKPEFMLSSVPDLREKPTRFAINIISAQQLPKPGGAQSGEIIDPFVVVHINGHPIDIAEHRTKTIADNGFNPIWNEVIYCLVVNQTILKFTHYRYSISASCFPI